MTEEEARGYLREEGYPLHVWELGKSGLVALYRQFVESVERGYGQSLFDYWNDLDIRTILAKLDAEEEVQELDGRLRSMLVRTDIRIWWSDAADPFWVYGYPRNAGAELLEDLRAEWYVD